MARRTPPREEPQEEPPVRAARQQLEALTPDETIEMGYPSLLQLRRRVYEEHLAAMEPHEEIDAWAARMTELYGPVARAWHQAVDWRTALLIARYGEDVAHWPDAWPADALERAATWLPNPAASRGIAPVGLRTERLAGERLYGLEEHAQTVQEFAERQAAARAAGQQATTAAASGREG